MTRWQQFYLEDRRVESAPPSHCVQRAITLFNEHNISTVLDVGCGVGRDTFVLAQQIQCVIGTDAARSGLSIAQQRSQSQKKDVRFVLSDARYLPFLQSSFEGVYCYGLLHEFTSIDAVKDVALVMKGIHNVLKKGGILVLAVLAGDPEQAMLHVRLFNTAMFHEITKNYLLIEQKTYKDVGCTGSSDYTVHYGAFAKP